MPSPPDTATSAGASGETPRDQRARQHTRRGALEQWLVDVDPQGRLECYLGTIKSNFDAVHQITDAYVSSKHPPRGRRRQGQAVQNGASKKVLDHQLFVDLGVDDSEHRELFRAWFAAKHGTEYEEPPPPPPAAPPPDEKVEDGAQGAADGYFFYPQDIPREQQNRARRLVHSTVTSWYPRERVHGPPRSTQGNNASVMLRLLRKGDACTYPVGGDTVTVHYTGRLADGTKFDCSRERGEPLRFVVGTGEVIAGWDEAILRMSLGERSVVHVPSVLAYGAAGAGDVIPPNADLDFDMELIGLEAGNQGVKFNCEDPRARAANVWDTDANPCMQDD